MNINIESIHFTADKKLIDYVQKKTSKLETYFDRIVGLDVILKLENSGQVRDKIAEFKMHVPGDTIFVKHTDKTFEAAADAGVDTLKRQLKKYKEKQRAQSN